MATAVKRKLSESTNGLGILIDDTATPGKLIHTAIAGTTDGTYDEVHLYATNIHTADVLVTVEIGGATAGDIFRVTVPYDSGEIKILDGHILQNQKAINIFAATDSVISILGWVNQTTD